MGVKCDTVPDEKLFNLDKDEEERYWATVKATESLSKHDSYCPTLTNTYDVSRSLDYDNSVKDTERKTHSLPPHFLSSGEVCCPSNNGNSKTLHRNWRIPYKKWNIWCNSIFQKKMEIVCKEENNL